MRWAGTEETKHKIQLRRNAHALSQIQIKEIEARLIEDPGNLDLRLQIFFWHVQQIDDNDKLRDTEKCFEYTKWLIENNPNMNEIIASTVCTSGTFFSKEQFLVLKEAWLKQVEMFPENSQVLGVAGIFIANNCIDEALLLFQKAHRLALEEDWLSDLVNGCSGAWHNAKDDADRLRISEMMFENGISALESASGANFYHTCDNLAFVALEMERPDILQQCLAILQQMDDIHDKRQASIYQGLLDVRAGDLAGARKNLLKYKLEHNEPLRTRLMKELFDLGDKEAVFKALKTRKHDRAGQQAETEHWLAQLASGEFPDFRNCCQMETTS